jgi:hypothetical protein
MVGYSSSLVVVGQGIARVDAEGHGDDIQGEDDADDAENGDQLLHGFRPPAVARMDRDASSLAPKLDSSCQELVG